MKTVVALSISALVLLVAIIFLQFFVGSTSEVSTFTNKEVDSVSADTVMVTRTQNGYEPREITVLMGTTVVWKNESGRAHWPASDNHPTHLLFSEFDPRRPVESDTTWSFTFDREGTWNYHDHLRASVKGTVNVTPL